MKKYIFTLLLLIPFLLPAQNYKNICTQGLTFYNKNNTNNVKAFRVDSIGIPVAGDTIFKSFRIIIDTNLIMCGDTAKGSILGMRVYKKNNGWFYFFNKSNDTVYLNTQAALNDTWRFYNITTATYLQAEVTSIAQDTVLGLLDNVKTITFQGKRDNGTNILHLFNGKTMKLSEHYGLSKTFNMVMTPFDTTAFKLVGKTHPVLGIQDFGWHEIYNMQVGDIFHYSGYHTAVSSGGGVSTTWLSMKKILTRTVHGNNDSVTYTYQLCKREQVISTGVITSTFDTITKTYNFVQLANDSSIFRMPDEFIRRNNYASAYDRKMNNYHSRQTKEIDTDKYRYMNHCWLLPEAGTINNNWYSEGLGISEYYKKNSNYIENEALVYYKKGMEIWGTPVSTDCNTLVSVEGAPVKSSVQVRVIPNPVNTRAEIIIDGWQGTTSLQIALFDYTGRQVYRNAVNSTRFTFDRSGIANGLYVLKITGGEVSVTSKLILE